MSAALDEYDDCEADAHRMRMGVMATLISSSSGGHREYIDRGREDGHQRLMDDYWSPNPTYNARIFRRRFRMQMPLFDRIMNDVVRADPFFAPKKDALNKVSLSPHQKITSAIFMLANGCSADSLDQLCRLGESTTLSCLKKFCKAIIGTYGSWYLRTPNPNDLRRLLEKATKRGFPGMIGSIDCMHWEWRNCPTAWAGQFTGHKHKPTIVLEAVASYDTWIWHAFFGTAGSNNDLNVLACSPVFDAVVNGCAPQVNYMVNNNVYNQCYYLADGIYPTWATFVKTISNPDTPKKRLFTAKQEAYRKDVERAFGILQTRWAIVRGPGRMYQTQTLRDIMLTCIILHNMIVEDEYEETDDDDDDATTQDYSAQYDYTVPHIQFDLNHDAPTLHDYMMRHNRIRSTAVHTALKNDLVNHLWGHHGNAV
ncbi:unnamed protein product [Cuscuta epithymum]|uniref:DDE Tnp4 domain-containing protein n=1 Tax=Cuscuta epithymum TaxID=186058 RepID=A0AAV0DGN9_9ASTE|nr:unnamed protein product [Cuscuta epithymum]